MVSPVPSKPIRMLCSNAWLKLSSGSIKSASTKICASRISAVCGELDVDGLRVTLSPTVRPVLSPPLKDALKSQKRMLLALRPAVCATACARTLEQVDSGDRVVKVFCKV